MFWVYVLQNPGGNFYVGHTDNLDRRSQQRNDPAHTLTSTTKRFRGPWKLVYFEEVSSRSAALAPDRLISSYSSTTVNRAKCATACAAKAYHESRSQTRRPHLSATAFEWNAYSLRIQPGPSRPLGTAAEVAGRVVRFVVRSTTDSYEKDAERSKTGVRKCLSPQEKASRGSRSSARRSYRAGRSARRANPIGRRRL